MVQFAGSIPDPLAQLEETLGSAVSDFPNDPSTYAPANRPQDIRYEFPERGAENHGVTEDALSADYLPDQVTGNPRIITDNPEHSTIVAEELIPPVAVAVYEVPNPQRSIRKYSTFQTLFNGYEPWQGASASGVDLSTVLQVSADENRVKATFFLGCVYGILTNQTLLAYYAISSDPLFQNYVLVGRPSASATLPAVFSIDNCKEGFYVAIAPLSASDPTKQLGNTLCVVQEFAQPIDHNPVRAD